MKKLILLPIFLLVAMNCMGQNNLRMFKQSNHVVKNISINKTISNKRIEREKYAPTFSVDLLEGSGIHLFTISNFGPLPTMNVGARINAGIKISL